MSGGEIRGRARDNLRLPELKARPNLGGKLVDRAVTLTLLAILLLAVAGTWTLSVIEVDITVEAAGKLEPLGQSQVDTAGEWQAMLRVAEREIDPIRIGDPVKLTVPALANRTSWMPERLPATVSSIGSEPLPESTEGRALYRVDATLDLESLDPEHRQRFRRGMTVEARIITRSARAIDLVTGHFKRQLGTDG